MNAASASVADQVHAQQSRWSSAANGAKRRIVFWRAVVLILGVAGAVLATLGAQLGGGPGPWLALAGGVAIGVIPFVTSRRLGREAIQSWTRLRSVSEGLKSELYRYLTRVGDYAGPDRDQKLLDAAYALREAAGDLASALLTVEPVGRPLPAVSDAESYVATRLEEQIDRYYRPRAARYATTLRRLQGIEFAVGLSAASLGAIAAATGRESLGAWVPVLTTIGVALLAHSSAARYQEDVIAFARTADRLEYLRDSWRGRREAVAAEADAELVDESEDAISIENQGWMAKWSAAEAGDAPPTGRS